MNYPTEPTWAQGSTPAEELELAARYHADMLDAEERAAFSTDDGKRTARQNREVSAERLRRAEVAEAAAAVEPEGPAKAAKRGAPR